MLLLQTLLPLKHHSKMPSPSSKTTTTMRVAQTEVSNNVLKYLSKKNQNQKENDSKSHFGGDNDLP